MLLCAQLLDSLLPCRETNCIAQDEDPQRHGTMPRVHQWHHSRSAFSMIFFESVAAFSFKRCYVMATVQQANKLLKNLFEAGMFQTLQNFFAVHETVRCSTQSRNLAERGLPEMAWISTVSPMLVDCRDSVSILRNKQATVVIVILGNPHEAKQADSL